MEEATMKKIGMLFALLAGALLAAHAHAQMPGQTYFGVGGGAMWTGSAYPSALYSTEDTTSGGKIYFGSMGETFGWEIGGYHLGTYDVNLVGTTTTIAESKVLAIAVSGVYAAELGGGYTFHAKAGIAFTQHEIDCPGAVCGFTESKKRGQSGLIGLGFGARLAQSIETRMDFEHFGGVHQAAGPVEYKDGFDMFSVSLQFNF
jgi:hypothetical protein